MIDENKLAELAETYAYVIEGALAYSWGVPLSEVNEKSEDNIEFIKANFVFLLRHYLEKEQTTDK